MMPPRAQLWLSWIAVGLLALVCALLGALQYRWTGEISEAERQRLQTYLRERLGLLQEEFNSRISGFCAALQPAPLLVEALGRVEAYASQYRLWRQSQEPLFRRVALAVPREQEMAFYGLDLSTAQFVPGEWPADWSAMRDRLVRRLHHGPAGLEELSAGPAITECPRFGPEGEQEWLLAEPDVAYLREKTFPELVDRYLAESGRLDYDAEVVEAARPSHVVYQATLDPGHPIGAGEDASVFLLDPMMLRSAPGRTGGGRGYGRAARGFGKGRGFREPGEPPPGQSGFRRALASIPPSLGPPEGRPGLWLLRVRHRAGSLEAQVARVRARNLAVSGGLLLLILATALLLVRLSRRAHQLADLEMNFVAGVSHELRTPLAVIHTAAYNLRGKLARQPEQVERYGALIQRESGQLSRLVEQVLCFAGASAGQVLRQREPVAVETLVERSLADTSVEATGAGNGSSQPSRISFEKNIPSDLPPVLADPEAMGHALRNLIENAVKYGGSWVGISAAVAPTRDGLAVEISVADRGSGIPAGEIEHVCDPFFRGQRAIQDQVHGTGLGLSLVKRIVEAHGGSLRVESVPGQGAKFVVRLPAATSLSQA